MSYPVKSSVTITTATGGGATGYSDVMTGRVIAVKYEKDTYASTSDFTITTADTGQSILSKTNVNASFVNYPVAAAVTTAGAASTLTEVEVPVVNERVKIVVAQGGNTKAGTFTIITA